jgi:hypothetical protein
MLSRKMLHLFERDIDHKNQTARTKGEESCAPAHCTEKTSKPESKGKLMAFEGKTRGEQKELKAKIRARRSRSIFESSRTKYFNCD